MRTVVPEMLTAKLLMTGGGVVVAVTGRLEPPTVGYVVGIVNVGAVVGVVVGGMVVGVSGSVVEMEEGRLSVSTAVAEADAGAAPVDVGPGRVMLDWAAKVVMEVVASCSAALTAGP